MEAEHNGIIDERHVEVVPVSVSTRCDTADEEGNIHEKSIDPGRKCEVDNCSEVCSLSAAALSLEVAPQRHKEDNEEDAAVYEDKILPSSSGPAVQATWVVIVLTYFVWRINLPQSYSTATNYEPF